MKSSRSLPSSTLEEVRREFVRWRAARPRQRRTPEELCRRAVGLLDEHCAFHVCRALGINAAALKRWAAENGDRGVTSASKLSETASFVALDVEPSLTELDSSCASTSPLTVELPGSIRIHCYSVPCTVDLLNALRIRNTMAGTS